MPILFIGLAMVASAAAAVACIHPGASVMVALLGRDKCISADSVNGCSWWPMSTTLSIVAALVGYLFCGYWALLFVPCGTLVTLIVLGLSLRFGEAASCVKEFRIAEHRVCTRSGKPIEAVCVETSAAYSCTGPASGYVTYALIVHDKNGATVTNGYTTEELYAEDLERLHNEVGLFGLDVVFDWRKNDKQTYTVAFSQNWAPLMILQFERLPEADQAFWRRFFLPAFGKQGHATVEASEVAARAKVLETTFAREIAQDQGLQSDCRGLQDLARKAGQDPIHVSTFAAHNAYTESCRGEDFVEVSSDGHLTVSTVKSLGSFDD